MGSQPRSYHTNRSARSALRSDRFVHIAAMARSHAHADGPAIPLKALRRQPSPEQRSVYARLRLFYEASARQPGEFPLAWTSFAPTF